jgi:hypothetical protein
MSMREIAHRDRVIDRVLQAIQAGSKGRAMK